VKINKALIPTIVTCALSALCIGLFALYIHEVNKTDQYEKQLNELSQKEKRSAVVRSVSAQMEQIAYQQKEISDEQRMEAEQQTMLANEMRLRSEKERQNALVAEKNALAARQSALEASHIAQQQRIAAEQQRAKADYARRVADTLGYLSLARSLGSQAATQYNTQYKDLASLLAYASYTFNNRYKGDMYQPAVYRAMAMVSHSSHTWSESKQSISRIVWVPNSPNTLVTTSTYGDIKLFEERGQKMECKTLFSNSSFDFRDIHIDDKGVMYAISRTGHMVVIQGGQTNIIPLHGMAHPMRIFEWSDDQLLIVARENMVVISTKTLTPTKTISQSFKTTCVGVKGNSFILFDDKNTAHLLRRNDTAMKSVAVPINHVVTSYAYSSTYETDAYGTKEGNVYLIDKWGNKRRLIGHRSTISNITFDGFRLFTTSYDGTVNFWDINDVKPAAMTVHTSMGWITSFAMDKSKNYIWTGNQHGKLTRTLISVPLMAQKIHSSLKRNMTQQEWSYYIGNNIPYEAFIKQ
jgi:WD40 repeat protein